MSQSYKPQSHYTKKNIKDSETDNIIQYNNNMLVLWKVYVLENRLVAVCTQTTV